MKKIIIAAYILLCICLTGCGGTNQKDYGENYNCLLYTSDAADD